MFQKTIQSQGKNDFILVKNTNPPGVTPPGRVYVGTGRRPLTLWNPALIFAILSIANMHNIMRRLD